MASGLNRLKTRQIETAKPGQRLSDGGGLYLCVGASAKAKTWAFLYYVDKKRRELGLGSVEDVSVIDARELAAKLRAAHAKGIDPKEERDRLRGPGTGPIAPAVPTFRAVAEEYIAAHSPGWKNKRHRDQWPASLKEYAYPVIGDLPVSAVDGDVVLRVLNPIWSIKTTTATRVRERIENIIGYAMFKKWHAGPNPALWRGGLANALPKPSKVKRSKHFEALPYGELPDFMRALAQQQGVAPLALRFLILTAARTNEVTGLRWQEIDEAAAAWTCPAERMKANKDHRVALSADAMDLLRSLPRVSEYVFPGLKPGRPLSHMAMLDVVRRMKVAATVHGFRATFRTWAAEQTSAQHDVVEACLAHATGSAVYRAYRRSDFFEARRALMETWARHCTGDVATNVVPLRAAAGATTQPS